MMATTTITLSQSDLEAIANHPQVKMYRLYGCTPREFLEMQNQPEPSISEIIKEVNTMNQKAKITAAKKAYELDQAGQLWTKPRGSRPITQPAILVVVNGLTYRVDTEAVKQALKPKKRSCKECKQTDFHKLDCTKRKKQATPKTGYTKNKQTKGE